MEKREIRLGIGIKYLNTGLMKELEELGCRVRRQRVLQGLGFREAFIILLSPYMAQSAHNNAACSSTCLTAASCRSGG